jgi:DNA polymerase-3 subunit alpha
MVEFAGHLHVHDAYSLLDGNANRNQLSYEAVRKGQTHLGFTNHGVLGGALEHVDACRHPEKYENPVNPGAKRSRDERLMATLGIEAFWRPNRFMDLTDKELYGKNGHNWAQHMCIHAGSLTGWKTLLRLSAKSWVRREKGGGFYGKPVMDMDMIKEDHEGLIFSTACINSPLAHLILAGDERGAKQWCKQILRYGPLWFELMAHDLKPQRDYNTGIINIANELGEPLVASGDVHTPYYKWKTTQSIVRMISYRQTLSDMEAKKEAGEDTYTEEIDTLFLSSGEEMREMFRKHQRHIPISVVDQALANTQDFFRSFKPWQFGQNLKLPHVEVDAKSAVWKWVQEGIERIKEQYPAEHWKRFPWETYETRIQEEWDVLVEKDVLAYFWIVGDIMRWARSSQPLPVKIGKRVLFPKGKRKKPIRCNLRGSAAGCIISYLIGISTVDPIGHDLLFERFLNADREGMPDIDIDLESGEEGRDLVLEYARIMYGRDHVASVIAYQTFAPRAVLKAVADTQEVDFKRTQEAVDSIGETERDLEKLVLKNAVLAKYKKDFAYVWEEALRLEDQIKNDSRHASAIIITDKPVTESGMAIQTASDRESIITAWADRVEFPVISSYGWQKFDFLGVNSLNKQTLALEFVERFYGVKLDLDNLPVMRDPKLADPKVMQGFKDRKTWDVFQFMGSGMTDALVDIDPDDVDELSMANALYRPGASSQIDEYAKRKRGEVKWTLWHESLAPFLGSTRGIIAFQEQVMQVCKAIGGFTGPQADFMRKAISKLYRLGKEEAQKEMRPYWEIWLPGCLALGIPRSVIDTVWALILEFGGYSFNKSHSSCYALQAYQDMHIKVYYPLAFYAAALTITRKQRKEDQAAFLSAGLREARTFGIDALPPDINHSDTGWTIDGKGIRFGLTTVNEMGFAAAKAIVDRRPYKSFSDFVTNTPADTNKKHAMALVKGGAFDSVEEREFLLGRVPIAAEHQRVFQVTFGCGCSRRKTVSLTKKYLENVEDRLGHPPTPRYLKRVLDIKVRDSMESSHCSKHPEEGVVVREEQFDTYTVAEWMRDHAGERPEHWEKPTVAEIATYERDALNISMTTGSIGVRYYDFIDARVMSAAEVADVPRKPKRKRIDGRTFHHSWCQCEDCEASSVVIGGEITRLAPITTKTKERMAFADMVFGSDTFNLTFFPEQYREYSQLLKQQTAFLVSGQKNDRGQISVNEMVDVVELAQEQGWEPAPLQKNGAARKRRARFRLVPGGGEQAARKAVASAS